MQLTIVNNLEYIIIYIYIYNIRYSEIKHGFLNL